MRLSRQKWHETLGAKLRKANDYGTSFWIERDGSFRIEDVPSGVHRLAVNAFRREDPNDDNLDQVAEFERHITIDDLSKTGGRSDEPLDLGTLTLNVPPRIRLGKPAPPLVVRKADGSELKLADLVGKFVLVVPWSESRRPSAEAFASIKEALFRAGDAKKLVVLTIEFNGDAAAADRLAKASGLDEVATHTTARFTTGTALVDMFSREPACSVLYLHQSSPITLIDPDGKVVAKNLTGRQIEPAVHRAMFER
jgi:hypothetical protein